MSTDTTQPTVSDDVWGPQDDQPIPYALTDEGKISVWLDALDVLPRPVLRWWASREGADL
ncbi:hypothetical protein [Serinibacter salmoneus]|uniref:Uncharacterized protein n=1 Tax=Serinibacter salmoneus TaxID=556530 RepID=A0A2A9CXR4_9MICO|nr:hypothetical protein [Serinibacter salmoneus]PFG19193.1 hypothetical protein ATL40_0750 [Serinibacter salmoneus]